VSKKDQNLFARLDAGLLESFRKDAKTRGMSLSAWVRLAGLKMVGGSDDSGTSLRDTFAAVAMHAFWHRPPTLDLSPNETAFAQLAKLAYAYADAMLAARAGPSGGKQEKK
jgi:hypothetical protein